MIKRFLRDESGLELSEYAVAATLVALATIAAFNLLETAVLTLNPLGVAYAALLVPLAGLITYTDIRYRRIPNVYVLATLVGGLTINTLSNGWPGAVASLEGCALSFVLMLIVHACGALGAGDVKLFAATGSVLGASLVLPTFLIVVLLAGLIAVFTSIRAGAARETFLRAAGILAGLLPRRMRPNFSTRPGKRLSIPYGVAITVGSLITVVLFRI